MPIRTRKKKSKVYTRLGPFTVPTLSVGASVTLVAPESPSGGSWEFVSSDDYIVNVTGNQATAVDDGAVTISAIQQAWGSYDEAHATDFLLIGPAQSTPVLGPLTIPNKQLCDVSFTIAAPTSASTGAWTFTSSNPMVISISGGNVGQVNGAGACVITATQAAVGSWSEASTTCNVTVTPRTNTLGAFTIPNKEVGVSFDITPPTSASTGAWTFTSSNPMVMSIVGRRATTLAAGGVTVTANQAAHQCYSAGTANASLTISMVTNTVGGFSVPDKTLCTPDFLLSPPVSNSSGLWSYTSSDTSVITVSGAYGHVVAPGTCVLTATQAATAQYPQTVASDTVTVTAKPNNVSPELSIPGTKSVGDPPFTLTHPTSLSTGAWTYSSSDPNVIAVTGAQATVIGAGACTITATQAAHGCYASGTSAKVVSVQASLTSIGPFTVPGSVVGGPSFQLTPPASNSPGSWTYTSSNPAILSISGGTATPTGVGSCVVTASQAASGNYGSATTTAPGVVSATNYELVITTNTANYNIGMALKAAYPTVNLSSPVSVTLTIAYGIWVYATTTGAFAIQDNGLAVGSSTTLINHGFIAGKGGEGGSSRDLGKGKAGGAAISVSRTMLIDNTDPSAYIGGGGGGGGSKADAHGNGGGGGGAGGGRGGTAAYQDALSPLYPGAPVPGGLGGPPGQTGTNGGRLTSEWYGPNIMGRGGGAGGGGGLGGGSGGGGGMQFPGDGGGAGYSDTAATGHQEAGAGGSGNSPGNDSDDTLYLKCGGGGGWGESGGRGSAVGGPGGKAVQVNTISSPGATCSFVDDDRTRVYGVVG